MKKKFQILVVEDQEDNSELAIEYLGGLGYELELATNGLEAIEMVKKNKDICLVLMDIKMPVMKGDDSLIEIRKLYADLPVIAVTAYALAGDREIYLEKGFNDYISKPMDLSILKAIVEKYENAN